MIATPTKVWMNIFWWIFVSMCYKDSWALLKPRQTPFGFHQGQKQVEIDASTWEVTFECIWFMRILKRIENRQKNGWNIRNAQFWALMKPHRPQRDFQWAKNVNICQYLKVTAEKRVNALDTQIPKLLKEAGHSHELYQNWWDTAETQITCNLKEESQYF